MNSELESVFAEDPPAVVLGVLEAMTAGDGDLPRAARLLEEEHDLGVARLVGRTLFQAVHHRGRWVALLMWGAAALKLADRDADIGWTDSQRAERIGLIVQNRRLIVREKTVVKTARKRFKVTAGKPAAATLAAAAAAAGVEKDGEAPVSCFPCTRPPGPAQPHAQLIRSHWGGCEIRNHGARDVQWEEDKTRAGNRALNTNLAILRVALIPVKSRRAVTLSWPRIFEQCAHSTVPAFSLINGKSIK